MALQTQNFNTLVSNQVAAIQASSTALLDFEVGSILLALVESNAANVGLFIQALLLQLLSVTRLATSTGSDVDSFLADFGLTRTPAVAATGSVTFSRFTNTLQALIPVGTTVQTADGTQSFTVIVDTTNPAYNAGQNGFIILSGTSSVTVTVKAVNAGSQGNVAANSITVITSQIPAVDTVNNASSFTNGIDQESDAACRTNFVTFLASLSKATAEAIGYAITQVQANLTYSLTENVNYSGSAQNGYFYAVINDGTGNPSSQLINNVSAAINLVRAFTISYGVFGPSTVTINVVMTVTAATGYVHSTIAPLVQTAVTNYINNLGVGNIVYYTRLLQVAYDASPGVLDVSSYTLNSGTADISISAKQVAVSGTITIN